MRLQRKCFYLTTVALLMQEIRFCGPHFFLAEIAEVFSCFYLCGSVKTPPQLFLSNCGDPDGDYKYHQAVYSLNSP